MGSGFLRLATVAMFYGRLRPGPPLPRNVLEAAAKAENA